MIKELKIELSKLADKTIFAPDFNSITDEKWEQIIEVFNTDYSRYYELPIKVENIKYFPGLLATLFYRISRVLFLNGNEKNALEISSVGTALTAIEIYFSAEIGKGLKINHGIGTVIGSRTILGKNVLLHQGVTLGEKNGGRAKIGDNVTVYPGAVIVGPIFIDDNSIVGANVFVDKSYPKKR